MTIRIVGIDQKELRQVTCKNCASILEYVLADMETKCSTDYHGSRDVTDYILCPRCAEHVIISER